MWKYPVSQIDRYLSEGLAARRGFSGLVRETFSSAAGERDTGACLLEGSLGSALSRAAESVWEEHIPQNSRLRYCGRLFCKNLLRLISDWAEYWSCRASDFSAQNRPKQ